MKDIILARAFYKIDRVLFPVRVLAPIRESAPELGSNRVGCWVPSSFLQIIDYFLHEIEDYHEQIKTI